MFREERNESGPLVGDTSAPAESVLAGYLAASDAGACVCCGGKVCFSKARGFAETFFPTFFVSQKFAWHPWEGVAGSFCFRLRENKAQRSLAS